MSFQVSVEVPRVLVIKVRARFPTKTKDSVGNTANVFKNSIRFLSSGRNMFDLGETIACYTPEDFDQTCVIVQMTVKDWF